MNFRELVPKVYVKYGVAKEYHEVDLRDFYDGDFNLFEPIPLTKEWMTKLGFRDINYKDRWYLMYDEDGDSIPECDLEDEMFLFSIDYEGSEANGWSNAWYFNGIDGMPDVSFRFVHELQNFYRAITMGKELKIK